MSSGQTPSWVLQGLPPPKGKTFIGGSKPPGGGFAKFTHLAGRNQYDGKRMRKAVLRRTVDLNSSIIRFLQESSLTQSEFVQPNRHYLIHFWPPLAASAGSHTEPLHMRPPEFICTKLVHTSINKIRCPVNALKWTPDGRRLITGCTSGEFTLWNGLTFNFETILQAHDTAVREMVWAHNELWMASSDHGGQIKYWQANMNNVKAWQAHKEPVRGLSFSPGDGKLASCSDDSTIRIWDFNEAREERMMTGHGWDVRCIDWHPSKGLLASGSKDNLVKLWDPKAGKDLATLHGFKNTVQAVRWNKNGHWLLAGSRDQMVKIFDLRAMKEMQNYKGHKKEINSISWNPYVESMFVSGGSEGSIYYWDVDQTTPVGQLESAHDSNVWALDWHPLGHILVSGSNDHSTRFWTRQRPGEDFADDVHIVGKPDAMAGMQQPWEKETNERGGMTQVDRAGPAMVGMGAFRMGPMVRPSAAQDAGGIPGLNPAASGMGVVPGFAGPDGLAGMDLGDLSAGDNHQRPRPPPGWRPPLMAPGQRPLPPPWMMPPHMMAGGGGGRPPFPFPPPGAPPPPGGMPPWRPGADGNQRPPFPFPPPPPHGGPPFPPNMMPPFRPGQGPPPPDGFRPQHQQQYQQQGQYNQQQQQHNQQQGGQHRPPYQPRPPGSNNNNNNGRQDYTQQQQQQYSGRR